jgi:uroporphyrinogen III methyltransferase/synthase
VTVYLVGAGPGDPGLLTVRGAALLRRAEVVVYDRLIAPSLLDLAPPRAELVDVGKRPGRPHRQDEINALLVDRGRSAGTVVRLKGGDPFLFGRGGEEAEALRAAGVPVEVVPGVTSAFAAPAAAGVPVTHRGLSTSVTVVTGHVGDVSEPGGVDWDALARAGGTLVVLMGMERRAEIAEALVAGGRAASTPVRVVHWGTTAHQRSVTTTLGELAGVELEAPSVIVVGPVAAMALPSIEARPLHGATVVVTRPRDQAGALVAALEEAGAEVVLLPAVAVEPAEDAGAALADALARIDRYDWLVCTSANAVDRVLAEIGDVRRLAGVRLAAVGPATAAALAARSLVADLVPDVSTGEGLAAELGRPAGRGRVLYPRSDAAGDRLGSRLRQAGWEVDDVVAYRTVAVQPGAVDPDRRRRAAQADVVTVASPSAARAVVALLAGGQPERCPPVAGIGPVTAAAARDLGLEVVAEAADPSPAGLVAALADWWSSGRAGPGAATRR